MSLTLTSLTLPSIHRTIVFTIHRYKEGTIRHQNARIQFMACLNVMRAGMRTKASVVESRGCTVRIFALCSDVLLVFSTFFPPLKTFIIIPPFRPHDCNSRICDALHRRSAKMSTSLCKIRFTNVQILSKRITNDEEIMTSVWNNGIQHHANSIIFVVKTKIMGL